MENKFGWRYYHFFFPGLFAFNVIEHTTDIFGIVKEPYISITGDILGKRVRCIQELDSPPNLFDQPSKFGEFTFLSEKLVIKFRIDSLEKISLQNPILVKSQDDQLRNYWIVDAISHNTNLEITLCDNSWNGGTFFYTDRQWGNLAVQGCGTSYNNTVKKKMTKF